MDVDRDGRRGDVLKAIAVAIDEKCNEVDRPRQCSEDEQRVLQTFLRCIEQKIALQLIAHFFFSYSNR